MVTIVEKFFTGGYALKFRIGFPVLITSLSLVMFTSSCGKKDVKTETPPEAVSASPPTEAPAYTDEQNDLETVHFDYNSAALSSTAKKLLRKNVSWLKQKAHAKVTIKAEGNCDERGSEEFNMKLGNERAQAVKHYLVSHGIHGKRVAVESFGKDHPIDSGHDEEAWAKNRRCAFRITSQ